MSSDKMKQLKNKLQSSARLLELRKPKHWPKRNANDSLKNHLQIEPNENLRWAFTIAEPAMEELMDRHQNIIIKIENNQLVMSCTDFYKSVDSAYIAPVQKQYQKRMRVLEVIKL